MGPTALIYGALELRLGIESALTQLLVRIRGTDLNQSDLKALRSAKSIQARIHQIEGHQAVLDKKMEFCAILLEIAGAPRFPLARLQVGAAFGHWRALSEICHFIWPWSDDTTTEALASLRSAEEFLEPLSQSMLVWPRYPADATRELERQFVEGEVGEEDVRTAIERRGAWGLLTHPDGRKEFASDVWGSTVLERDEPGGGGAATDAHDG